MSTQQLAALIDRLEDVTVRLEQSARGAPSTATTKKHSPSSAAPAPAPAARGIASRGPPPASPASAASGAKNFLDAFDEIMSINMANVVSPATHIGGKVQEVTQIIEKAFKAERDIVEAMSKCTAPHPAELQKLVEPCSELMIEACDMAAQPQGDATHHCKAACESLQALAWVVSGPGTGLPLPPVQVTEMWQCAEVHVNKILRAHRGSGNPAHVEWANALRALFAALNAYVRRWHPSGPSWNRNGVSISSFKPSAPAPDPPLLRTGSSSLSRPGSKLTTKAPPPPPPPPSIDAIFELHSSKTANKPKPAGGNMGALLQQIGNRGDSVTSGLRHVTKDMRTSSQASPARPTMSPGPRGGSHSHAKHSGAPKKRGPPRFELEDKRWHVENMVERQDLVIEGGAMNHAVYFTSCNGCVLQVKGKVNAVLIDGCTGCGLVFESVVASVDVINCAKVQVQCTGSVPTIAVDKTDNLQIFLAESALDVDVVTAKSSEVNITVPGVKPDDDMVEHAIAEQFVSTFENGQFVTRPVVHRNG